MGASEEELDAAMKDAARRLKEEQAAANAELVRKETQRKLEERAAEYLKEQQKKNK